MTRFLVGLFTHHLVTKIVSLLLAIVLFVFVQQSISETQRIERIVIALQLSPEQEKTKVLLNEYVVLRDITVSGLRESLTREMSALRAQGFRIEKTIDDDFLKRHPMEDGIVFNAALCREEGIPWELGTDFELRIEEPPALQIEPREEITLRPTLSEAELKKLDLPADYKFTRTGPLVWGKPSSIAVSGPSSALPEGDRDQPFQLYVKIDLLKNALDQAESLPQAREARSVTGIDWIRSGFKPELHRHIRIEEPSGMTTENVSEAITYTVPLEFQRKPIRLRIPMHLVTSRNGITRARLESGEFDRVGAVGIADPDPPVENLDTVVLPLEVTSDWIGREEELAGYLVLVVDLTQHTGGDAQMIVAPIHLKALTEAPPGLLNEVRLQRSEEPDLPAFRFRASQ